MFFQIAAGVVFFLLIIVSIALHELGHFFPSKWFGVRVRQYMVGFGPTLWSTQKGETEYGIKAIPLGGYCAIVGMVPPYKEGKNTWLKRFADSIRAADWENITDQDVEDHRLFYQQSFPKRTLIMAGGVLTNLLLSFGLFLGVNLVYGQYDQDTPTLRVHSYVECVQLTETECTPTPAAEMGIQPGDTITAVNGTPVDGYDAYMAAIDAASHTDGEWAQNPLTFTVDRPGAGEITLPTVTGLVVQYSDGTISAYTGISVWLARVPVGPLATLKEMGDMTVQSVAAIVKLPVLAWQTLADMVTGQPRDEEGVMSVVGAARIAGEVAGSDQFDWGAKIAIYVQLLGGINLFVALLNLVPLLPFDGGHVAAGLYGVIRSWIAKLRGKPDPGPVDAAKLQPVAYIVGAFLILAGAVLILADIISPITIF